MNKKKLHNTINKNKKFKKKKKKMKLLKIFKISCHKKNHQFRNKFNKIKMNLQKPKNLKKKSRKSCHWFQTYMHQISLIIHTYSNHGTNFFLKTYPRI